MSGVPIGIDLGTTNSAVAVITDRDRAPTIAPGPSGERVTPSAIFFTKTGEVLIGAEARDAGLEEPEALFEHWKRDMGDPGWSRVVRGRTYTPVLLSSLLLRRLLDDAARATGDKAQEAVIAVPASAGELERGALSDAGRIAGLSKVHMINEPTAAALSFGLDPKSADDRPRRAVVYDLGGGTFDVTVVELHRGRVKVLATAGEPKLGGKDWDDELVNLVAEHVADMAGCDPREDDRTLGELRRRVEEAKHELSRSTEAFVRSPLPAEKSRTLPCPVTRAQFESRTRPLLEQTETQLTLAIQKAKLSWREIDFVLPTGGATRMPAVRELLRRVSGREPLEALDPDVAVARGAALYAALLARGSSIEQAVADEVATTGIAGLLPGTANERAAASAVPSESAEVEDSFSESSGGLPLLPGVHIVPEVQDVLAHGLGVLCVTKAGFKNVVLIPEQTPVPVKREKRFKTVRDDQPAVIVKVLEGETTDAEQCTLIGTLVVDGLPRGRPKGQRVSVTYSYDDSGRLRVEAKDVATGRRARATIERRGALAEREIERLRDEIARQVKR